MKKKIIANIINICKLEKINVSIYLVELINNRPKFHKIMNKEDTQIIHKRRKFFRSMHICYLNND